MNDLGYVLLAVALVFGNGFFVAAEFALVSARRSQIEPLAQAGSSMARTTLTAMQNMPLVIGVNQLGITICSLLLGAVGEPAIAHLVSPALEFLHLPHELLHPVALVIALGVVVFLHVVIGEMVPKNVALAGPDRAAMLLGPPIWAIARVFRPLLIVVNAIAKAVLGVVGVKLANEVSATYTREEVTAMVEESRGEGLIEAAQYDRLSGALGWVEKDVTSVLMPWETLSTISLNATLAEVEEVCAATGYSRFPVVDAEGHAAGYLHIKDVLEVDPERRADRIGAGRVRPLTELPGNLLLHEALGLLRRDGSHLGKVVDATGNLLGVVALEDVLEELVGEIRDAAHADSSG